MNQPQKETSANRKKKRRAKSLARRNLKNWLRYFPYILPLIITAFVYTWLHTRLTIVTLPIKSLRDQKTDLIKQNDSIRLCIEQLQAPQRIESIARKKLGMVPPEKWQVVALEEPLRATEPPVDTSRQAQAVSLPKRKTVRLFGFLRRHGARANNLAKNPTSEVTGQVELSSVSASTATKSQPGIYEDEGRPGVQVPRLGSGR